MQVFPRRSQNPMLTYGKFVLCDFALCNINYKNVISAIRKYTFDAHVSLFKRIIFIHFKIIKISLVKSIGGLSDNFPDILVLY